MRGDREGSVATVRKCAAENMDLWEAHYALGYLLSGYDASGSGHVHEPRYEESAEAYTKALRLQPVKANLYQNRGAMYFMQFQKTNERSLLKKAVSDFQMSASLAPSEPRTWKALLKIHYIVIKDYDAALDDVNMLLILNPNHHALHATKGYIYEKQGLYEKALESINRALGKDPDNKTFLDFKKDMEKEIERKKSSK